MLMRFEVRGLSYRMRFCLGNRDHDVEIAVCLPSSHHREAIEPALLKR